VQCDSGSNWTGSAAGNGSAARATTTSYDTTTHLYSLQVCNALGQCSATEYYGVNAVGAPADGGLPGQVWRAWDANGEATATRYTYDQWGRLRKVVRPGDDLDHPTPSYAYWDDPTLASGALFLSPLLIGISYKDNLQQGVRQFYDGLG